MNDSNSYEGMENILQRQIEEDKTESKNEEASFLRETKCKPKFDVFSFESRKRDGSIKVSSMFCLIFPFGSKKLGINGISRF
jgi:hypothetical protein